MAVGAVREAGSVAALVHALLDVSVDTTVLLKEGSPYSFGLRYTNGDPGPLCRFMNECIISPRPPRRSRSRRALPRALLGPTSLEL